MKPKVNGKMFSKDYQPQTKWTQQKAMAFGYNMLNWIKTDGNLFFEDYLMIENDYYLHLPTYLSNKFSSFLQLMDTVKQIQELKLIKYGCEKKLNVSMAKFMLINNHQWRNKGEVNQRKNDG